ncbi:RNA-binding RNA annealing protein, variant 2 [Entomophthora muscae]|uniref:RNA-binding RNA annealing protein, variant 2 n=1 Tax=Entomophthora muscae TaxID=34485 RepID=A0ACC2S1N3_9FUNG|nr:RNA-binding RNA annealing protein, variant 2 [Entomophthora muscae]
MFSPTLACQPIRNSSTKVKLIVSGFPQSVDEMDVYDMFRSVGPIFTCSIFYNKWGLAPPCALVQFINDELNHQAMVEFNKSHSREAAITIEAFDEYLHWEYDVLNRLPVDPSKVFQVEVSSLPATYDRRTLLKLFRSVGLIVDAEFDAASHRCLISYDCAAECSNAAKRFDGYLFEAASLKVQECHTKLKPSPLPTALSFNAKHSPWNQKVKLQLSTYPIWKNFTEKSLYPSLSINISFDPVNLFSVTCQDPQLPASITAPTTKSNAQLKGHSFLEPCLSETLETSVVGFRHSISASKDHQTKDLFKPNKFPNRHISSFDGTPTLSQFLDSGMYAIFDGLLERLTPASDSTRQKIAISLFEKAPSNVVKLARDIQELSDKITKESNIILQNQESFPQPPGNELVL